MHTPLADPLANVDRLKPIYAFYWEARAFLGTSKSQNGHKGVRHRLEQWLRLCKCVLWFCRHFVPAAGGERFQLISFFLVRLGRT